MSALALKKSTGLDTSNSYLTPFKWMSVLAGVALSSTAPAAPVQKNESILIVFPDALGVSNNVTTIEPAIDEVHLLREMERVARGLAQVDVSFDDVTIRAIYSDSEDLYV